MEAARSRALAPVMHHSSLPASPAPLVMCRISLVPRPLAPARLSPPAPPPLKKRVPGCGEAAAHLCIRYPAPLGTGGVPVAPSLDSSSSCTARAQAEGEAARARMTGGPVPHDALRRLASQASCTHTRTHAQERACKHTRTYTHAHTHQRGARGAQMMQDRQLPANTSRQQLPACRESRSGHAQPAAGGASTPPHVRTHAHARMHMHKESCTRRP